MNILEIFNEQGQKVRIRVLDIIDSDEFKKSFIIYNIEGNEEEVYASILNESENSYSLDSITNENELSYISNEINNMAEEMDENDIL